MFRFRLFSGFHTSAGHATNSSITHVRALVESNRFLFFSNAARQISITFGGAGSFPAIQPNALTFCSTRDGHCFFLAGARANGTSANVSSSLWIINAPRFLLNISATGVDRGIRDSRQARKYIMFVISCCVPGTKDDSVIIIDLRVAF